jgi:hypothetical protein
VARGLVPECYNPPGWQNIFPGSFVGKWSAIKTGYDPGRPVSLFFNSLSSVP